MKKKKFIPAETAKETEMMRTIKGFESSKDIDEVIKKILLENCYKDSYTLVNLCEKHKEKMCPYHKFKVNPNCVCYNGMLLEKKTEQVQRMYVFSYMGFKTHKFYVK